PPWQFFCTMFLVRWRRRRRHFGEIDSHLGAPTRFALDANVAAALAHDAVTGGETQTATQSFIFGGEERLKKMRFHFITHSDPGVGDTNEDVWARADFFRATSRLRFLSHVNC